MPWIETEKEEQNKLYNSDLMDEPIYFNENGKAQVKKEVAKRVVANYPLIQFTETKEEKQ